jgi:hypothetical protein
LVLNLEPYNSDLPVCIDGVQHRDAGRQRAA